MKGIQLSMLEAVKPYPLENRSFESGEWLHGQTAKGQAVAGQYAGLSEGLVQLSNGKAITLESAQRFDLKDLGDRLQIVKHHFDDRKAQAEERQARYAPEHREVGDRLQNNTAPALKAIAPLPPCSPAPPPSPLPSASCPLPSPRRRSPRGQASGWIEERQGNRKRKTPSTSYYYGWQDKEGKYKRYIPASKVYRVQQMIAERKAVAEILSFLDPNP